MKKYKSNNKNFKNKKKVIFIVALLLLTNASLFAQKYNLKIDGIYSKNYVQTPEMSAIKQIALSSVNYSTGSVDIKIPLFTIESGDLSLPIYLSYNTTGIKVNEPCGWVGQNWFLHAEPTLTRSPKGHIDFAGACDYEPSNEKGSYFWTRKYLDKNIFSSLDMMPDEYNFTLPSGGGMFMYCSTQENKSQYVCLPYDDLNIAYSGFFTITDPLGTVYKYNGGVDWAETSRQETSWHASIIKAANGIDSISFAYKNKQRIHIKRHEDYITVVDDYMPSYAMGYSGGWTNYGDIPFKEQESCLDIEELFRMPVIYKTFDNQTSSYQMNSEHTLVDDGRAIEKVEYLPDLIYQYQHLSEISFAGNKAVFCADKDGFLTDIVVTNWKNQQIKHFTLEYEAHRERHYLISVKELSSENDIVSAYNFSYNNPGDVCLPGGRAYDFWGYNNSDYLYNDISLVPTMKLYINRLELKGDYVESVQDSISIGGDPNHRIKSRQADEYYMQCGILSSIEHPTGAKENFVWEANKARIAKSINYDETSVFNITDELEGKNGIYVLGGLRIKEINLVDSNNTKLRRTYIYGEKEDGAGTTPLRNGTNYFMKTQKKIYNNKMIQLNLGESTSRYRTLSSTPIVPFTYYNGTSVMYNKVTEITSIDDTPIKKNIYKYTLPDLGGYLFLTQNDIWDYHVHNYASWFSDHLDKKETYEYSNGNYKKISVDSYSYDMSSYPKKRYTIKGREYRNNFQENFSDSELSLISSIVYGDYLDYSATPKAKLLVSQSHTEFMFNGTEITTSKVFKYENPSDIRQTSQIISQGEEEYSIHTSYPSKINNGIYAEMTERNMLDYPIEERVVYNNYVISSRLMTYTKEGEAYYPNKIYTYTPGAATCSASQFNSFDGTSINKIYTPILTLAYSNGRINCLTDNQGMTTNYTWDKYLQKPITEIKTGGDIMHKRTFTYIPCVGMTSETAPNKQVTSYIYDNAGRLAEIRDHYGNTTKKYIYKYVSGSNIKGVMKSSNK